MSRRSRPRLPVVLVALVAALVVGVGGFAGTGRSGGAQEAGTPAPQAGQADEGVLLQATLDRNSAGPAALQLLRIMLEPGARSPLHTHPGPEFGIVESGTLTVQVAGRAVLLSSAGEAAGESTLLPVGVEVTLGPGDRIAYAPGTQMTFRNAGSVRTSLLAATMLPTGVGAPPGVVWADGRPSAEDVAGVTSQLLGQAVAYNVGQGRVALTLERLVLASGDSVPGYAGPVLVAVETGALAGSVEGGSVELPVASPVATGADGTPQTSFSVGAGEFLFFPEGMAQTPPLGGDGTVVLLRLGLVSVPADFGDPTATASPPPTAAPEATVAADAEATAAADAEALPVGTVVVVAVEVARLRAEPSLEGPVLDGLEEGRALVVTGPPETDVTGLVWYPVEDAADPSVTGYIAADLIEREG